MTKFQTLLNKILILFPVLGLVISLGLVSVYAQNEPIPKWIKGVAAFWAEDKISDAEFIEALEFLINQNVIKISDQNNIVVAESENNKSKFQENMNQQKSKLASCIDAELASFVLIREMIDYTNSKNLPPNSYDVLYPDSLIDELASVVQQSSLQKCHELLIPIYLDSSIKQEGRSLVSHAVSSVNQYGYDESESCNYEPRCMQSITALSNLGNNSVKDDVILLVIFLELDSLIS